MKRKEGWYRWYAQRLTDPTDISFKHPSKTEMTMTTKVVSMKKKNKEKRRNNWYRTLSIRMITSFTVETWLFSPTSVLTASCRRIPSMRQWFVTSLWRSDALTAPDQVTHEAFNLDHQPRFFYHQLNYRCLIIYSLALDVFSVRDLVKNFPNIFTDASVFVTILWRRIQIFVR